MKTAYLAQGLKGCTADDVPPGEDAVFQHQAAVGRALFRQGQGAGVEVGEALDRPPHRQVRVAAQQETARAYIY